MDNYVKNYEDLSGEMVSTSVFASLMRKVYLWMAGPVSVFVILQIQLNPL